MENKYLWSFYWDCGRSGSIEGLFVATERAVNNAIGNKVNFGEVLGKHSEVYGTLDKGDISKVDISPEAVAEVSTHLGLSWSGFNPLSYVSSTCEICNCTERASEWDCEYREEMDGKMICHECLVDMRKIEDENIQGDV